MDLKNLITEEDKNVLHELKRIVPQLKNRWFSLGRDMDKLVKLCEKFGATCDKP